MKTNSVIFEGKGYQINRANRCCVCGKNYNLSRHHLIPSCYIKSLKQEIKEELKKDHVFYYEWDYSCLCGKCHQRYEINFGDNLHKIIWDKYQVDLKLTSYRNQHSNLPKPSEIVMSKINNKEEFIELRDFCINYFKNNMKPKFDLI